jgi:hypothetical protein
MSEANTSTTTPIATSTEAPAKPDPFYQMLAEAPLSGTAGPGIGNIYYRAATQLQTTVVNDRRLGGTDTYPLQASFPVWEIEVLNLPYGREFCLEAEDLGRSNMSVDGVLKMSTIKFSGVDVLSPKDQHEIYAGPVEEGLARLPAEIQNTLHPHINLAKLSNLSLVVPGDEFYAHQVTILVKCYNILLCHDRHINGWAYSV